MDTETMSLLRFDDLVNLQAEIQQLRAELDDLRTPVPNGLALRDQQDAVALEAVDL
jgi:hypothetical protein